MIIWIIFRGFGFLVPIVTLGFLVLVEVATRFMIKEEFYYQAHGWPKLLGLCLAAATTYPLAKYYDSRPGRIVIDKSTGKEVVLKAKNSLLFIPMKYWPYLLLVAGAYFFVHTDRPTQTLGNEAGIERAAFSMILPKGWTEDTKGDIDDPNSFATFQGPQTCFFAAVVRKQSAGATVEDLLRWQYESWRKRLTVSESRDIKIWSKYEGNGFELEGKLQGVPSRTRVFGFREGDTVCLIVESGALADLETFADDSEKIRQTFKLK